MKGWHKVSACECVCSRVLVFVDRCVRVCLSVCLSDLKVLLLLFQRYFMLDKGIFTYAKSSNDVSTPVLCYSKSTSQYLHKTYG